MYLLIAIAVFACLALPVWLYERGKRQGWQEATRYREGQ